jgi:hypothetical protein
VTGIGMSFDQVRQRHSITTCTSNMSCRTSLSAFLFQKEAELATDGRQTVSDIVGRQIDWEGSKLSEGFMVRNLLRGLAATILGAALMIQPSHPEDHPTVGVVAPFSGAYAEWGDAYKREIDLAMSEFNGKDGNPKINLILRDAPGASDVARTKQVESRPKELHLRPLAERCRSLSTHTAPIRQTRRCRRSANGRTKTGSALQYDA